jgi:hypothetical protein
MLIRPRFGLLHRRDGQIRISIYRRNDDLGRGVAFSVYKHGRELRRYDLFPHAAHMHVRSDPGQPRRYFPPGKTVIEYGELAIADLIAWRPFAIATEHWLRNEIARRSA